MLDPSIPLSVRPPQLMNLQDVFNAQRQQQQFETQQQLAQSQLKSQGLEQQQQQMAIEGTQALNEAYKQPGIFTTGADGVPVVDPNAISSVLASKGQGHLIPSVTKSFLDMQEAAGKVTKQRADLATAEADYAGSVGAAAVTKNPDGTKIVDPDRLAISLQHAIKLYGPQGAAAQALQALQADPSKAQSIAEHLILGSPAQRKIAAEEATADSRTTTAETGQQRLAAELPKIAAETQVQQQTATGQKPIQPAEAATIAATQAARAETARHNVIEEKQGAGRLGIEGARLNLQREQAGFEMNGAVSPAATMAAEGRMDPATLRAMLRKSPGVVGQIQRLDPKWDEADIDKRYNVGKEFASSSNGKAGGQVIALNTLIHHADLYQQAADALKNRSFKPGNAAYNAVATLFGSAPPQSADLVARFLAGETGKVATGGVPAEGEINGILKSLGNANSPDQIKDAGDKLLEIATGKAIPLMEKVKDAKLDNVYPVIGPDAKQILTRRGYNPDTLKRGAQPAAGGVQLPPEAKSQLKEGMHTTFQNGQVWTLQNGQPVQVQQAGK